MGEPVFLVALAIAATTAVLVARAIAGAIAGRGAAQSQIAQVREQLEQQAAALEDTQATLASQSTQLSELHERLDFAERILAQVRERPALGPGDKHG